MKLMLHTWSGKELDPTAITTDDISIRDIAHGLSQLCRYCGQSSWISVAQHSLLVCSMVADMYFFESDPEFKRNAMLLALLHDASEAYLGDLIAPVKEHCPAYVEIEKKLIDTVYTRFNLTQYADVMEKVHKADVLVRSHERMTKPMEPWEANTKFLDKFLELCEHKI